MTKGIPVDPTTKAEVIKAIREEGLTIDKASQVFGIGRSTISHWLSKETHVSDRNYISQINQLKKRLDNAYRVIGRLTAEVQRPKD